MKGRREKTRKDVELRDNFVLSWERLRTFKNADGKKPVEGQLKIKEREGLKGRVRSARRWEVVGFRVSLRQEKGPLFL